jgi:glycosyltransferase involved in cell wall biosynthesis
MINSISLHITVYNRSPYLASAIESVLAQTYPHFELLIWDDGSTDRSLEIAHDYAKRDSRIHVIAASHQGIAPALKGAIASTTGNYLGWVDSDDILAPTALEETIAVLNTYPEVGMVYTDYQMIDEQGKLHGIGSRCQIHYSKERLLVDFMTFHFRLIRRAVYDQVGGIDPTFAWAEDYDLCLKLSEVTAVHHLPKPLYSYRRHAGNATHHQLDVIHWSAIAISKAMVRRGLDQHYQLDLDIVSSFRLIPKPATAEPVLMAPAESQLTLPLVSIIIPCYNAATRIETCLQSCLLQTYPHLEIIVVDNNSSDRSAEIVQRLAEQTSRPLWLKRCAQQGQNYARNFGFTQARGEYIQWLDADDELKPDKIASQVAALESQLNDDIAYGEWDWCFWRDQQLKTQLTFAAQQYEDYLLQALMDNWRPNHSYLLRRSAANRLHQLQAWHPLTCACTDREYFTLAAIIGCRFLYVPGASVRYNSWSSTQVTGSMPYAVRVASLRQMFHRFQGQVQTQIQASLQKTHGFLLSQSWDLWQPAFVLVQESDDSLGLQHHHTQQQVGLTLTEATMVKAWLQSPGACTIEDHARRIVQQLWRETLVRVSQSQQQQQVFNHALISRELSRAIGLPVDTAGELQSDVPGDTIGNTRSSHRLLDSAHKVTLATVQDLIQAFPLYTPLFGEQRLVVQVFLERLRQQGWLEQPKESM